MPRAREGVAVVDEDLRAGGDVAGGVAGQSGPAVDGALALREAPARSPEASRARLLASLSGAFDLAEGQPAGHARRVAYLTLEIGRELGVDAATRRQLLATALLHDSGIAVRALPDGSPAASHMDAGAWVAERLGYPPPVREAIRATHERWDGTGRARGLAAGEIPIEALAVSAAHWACDAADVAENPLLARVMLRRASQDELRAMAGPRVAQSLRAVLSRDSTWLALWDPELAAIVAAAGAGERGASARSVERVAAALGDVVDAASRESGRSRRVSALATEIARRMELDATRVRAIGVAALVMDVGLLGVPRHITEKPAILSVEEMEVMRRHPGQGAQLLTDVAGFEEVGDWVESHHERPDGRGYPDMLTDDELALPPRILAVADAYCALRAERPYRPALAVEAALEVLRNGAGEQFDPRVVGVLPDALPACEPA